MEKSYAVRGKERRERIFRKALEIYEELPPEEAREIISALVAIQDLHVIATKEESGGSGTN